MQKNWRIILAVLASILFFSNISLAGYKLDKNELWQDLVQASYEIAGDKNYHGIPCLQIELPVGQSIIDICRNVPALNRRYFEAREAIAVINGLNMFYSRGYSGKPYETTKSSILIPLDTTIQPKAFPKYEQSLEKYRKTILVDRHKQLLAYYEQGRLIACFPVSTGRAGKATPSMSGFIRWKDLNHVSSIYDVLMPFSLHLSGPYFLHGGVMTGQPDSAGCVRLFTEHAQWLFDRVGSAKVFFSVK